MNIHRTKRVVGGKLTLLCALALLHATSRAVSAQSTIFQDEFNHRTLDTSSWRVYSIYETMHRTQYGLEPTMQSEAGAGYARFYMDTYHPDPAYRGRLTRGSGMTTYVNFGLGGGVEFEARVRGTNVPRGAVFAFFPYGDKDPGSGRLNDEIDFEIVTNWPTNQLLTNVWNDGNTGASRDTPPAAANYNWTQWTTYRARWYADRVEWYINDVWVRTEYVRSPNRVPDDPMALHLNFWAPDASWPDAADLGALVPVSAPAQNTCYFFDVDYVRVRSLAAPIQVVGPGGTGGGTGGSNGSSSGGAPVVGTGNGLTGTYFSGTQLQNPVATRVDPQIVFDWDNYTPGAGIPFDYFSVRWTGHVQAQYSQPYTFHLESDDGARLWVNDQLLIDNWRDPGLVTSSGTIDLVAGVKYNVRLEYYDVTGMAQVILSWHGPYTSKQFIPRSQLYANSLPPAQSAFNKGLARAGSKVIRLNFNVPLTAAIVKDKSRYRVTVDGTSVSVTKVAFSGTARSGIVTLTVSRILKRSETVVATWQGLREKNNNPVADGSWSGTVS
jgi:hypothetical protein